ncbi:MAG: hypothetical protein JRG85_15660, partial [Deltaproteobacteria bacterium]|nr:hypothetical protein [Deltaproteobacteria bacterium]
MHRTATAFLLIVATALLGACSSRRAPARARGAAPTSIAFPAGAPAAWPTASSELVTRYFPAVARRGVSGAIAARDPKLDTLA